jgi:hypothetical protein
VEWDGRQVDTVASQFVAYLDGRIREVAIDYLAQADDGSVWYFGEDVDNYRTASSPTTTAAGWPAGTDRQG